MDKLTEDTSVLFLRQCHQKTLMVGLAIIIAIIFLLCARYYIAFKTGSCEPSLSISSLLEWDRMFPLDSGERYLNDVSAVMKHVAPIQ